MNSSELYKEAYALHYKDDDYEGALEKYKEIQILHPDSEEASWATSQIENINKASAMEQRRVKSDERSCEKNLPEKKRKSLPSN